MPKITVPRGRPKGSKNKKEHSFESHCIDIPIPEPIRLPSFLEIVESENYFASNKGRLTNAEIIENNLEFACTTGNVWNYKFK